MNTTANVPAKNNLEASGPERTRGATFTPRVDIVETEQELLLLADVPGARPEDVDLRYDQGQLTLHGRVKPRHDKGDFLLQEYEVGDFYRAFAIHETIDASKISAEFKDGVLKVRLPKMEAVKPRKISIAGG